MIPIKLKNKGDHIREANAADVHVLAGLIRQSYRDVADRFQLTPANCPIKFKMCELKG
jgi:hypothetical protein